MRSFISGKNPDAILLAEANAGPETAATFLRGDKRMHMIYAFHVNQHLLLSLVRENAQPLIKSLRASSSANGQWLHFLRHHDAAHLSLLTRKEVREVFEKFAPEENMRIHESSIRRRLAPMLNGDPKLIRFCHSLLFSLPGTVMIRYGDEIGMGDKLKLPGRESVRTLMQWNSAKNGGFSTGDQTSIEKKIIDSGKYSYEKLNVLKSQSQPSSLLNWIEQLISIRKQNPEIGEGEFTLHQIKNDELLLHSITGINGTLLFLHHFSQKKIKIPRSDLFNKQGKWIVVLGSRPLNDNSPRIQIGPFDFFWWRKLD